MPRRTKEEAQQTREALIEAAEVVFHRKGVSASSLNDIAKEAGVTRGAVYWHFKKQTRHFPGYRGSSFSASGRFT